MYITWSRASSRLIRRFGFYALTVSVLLFLSLYLEKMWSTNDDANMAMIVHGYGIAGAPSPGLVYSNIVWGWLLSHSGALFGVQAYTAYIYAMIVISFCAFVYAFDKAAVPSPLAGSVLFMTYRSVILSPEFTVVAGYLAASGMALVLVCLKGSARRLWFLAGLLLLLAQLVRGLELLFVLLVSVPFFARYAFPGGALPERRAFLAFAAVTGLLLLGCHALDVWYYSSSDWALFNDISNIRRQFVNYRLDVYFAQHPDALAKTSLSRNDIALISDWFYLDPTVFNSGNFRQLMDSIVLSDRISMNLGYYHGMLRVFSHRQMLFPEIVLLLTLPVTTRPRALLASCALLVFAMFAFLVLGRPGIMRIYTPVMLLLCAFALLHLREDRRRYAYVVGMGVLVAVFAFTYRGLPKSSDISDAVQSVQAVRAEICSLPHDKPMVVWGIGDTFRYRYVYRPFSPVGGDCNLSFYPIGALELAAPVLAHLRDMTGHAGLVDALRTGMPFYMVTTGERLDMLKIYFKEHYAQDLESRLWGRGEGYEMYEIRVTDP